MASEDCAPTNTYAQSSVTRCAKARGNEQPARRRRALSCIPAALRAPEVVDDFTVRFDVRSEDEHLEPVGSGFEAARDARADAYRVERGQLHELLIELDASGAGEDDVDLLRGVVAMGEGLSLPG